MPVGRDPLRIQELVLGCLEVMVLLESVEFTDGTRAQAAMAIMAAGPTVLVTVSSLPEVEVLLLSVIMRVVLPLQKLVV